MRIGHENGFEEAALMTTRTALALMSCAFAVYAALSNDLAALFVAVFGGALLWQVQVVESKLDKLLQVQDAVVGNAKLDS
jgi:hypothetical protein